MARPSLKEYVQKHGVVGQLKHLAEFGRRFGAASSRAAAGGLEQLSVECAVCGIAVNEVEGLLMENRTVSDIEQALDADLCALLGATGKAVCDQIVDMLPAAIGLIEKHYTVDAVCMELNICAKPIWQGKDPQAVPNYVVDLDRPPLQRWTEVCSNPSFQKTAQFLVSTAQGALPDGGKILNGFGDLLNMFVPQEFGLEIQGCAAALGIPYGWATLMNLGYELSDACTSIVAQTPSGEILHGRNLDFWAGMGFTDSLKNMTFVAEFQRGGRTLFTTVSFASFVGVLSGIQTGAFAVTIDTRFYPEGLSEMFLEIVAAIEERNASLVTFLSREVIQNEHSFAAALSNLSDNELIADVYYILSGVNPGEGAVISRNRLNATNVWMLDAPKQWYVLETNYDHWKPAPWFDDRRTPGIHAMDKVGQNGINTQSLWNVMSTKPVLNLQTTYTVIMVPKNGSISAFSRWCPFPCTQ